MIQKTHRLTGDYRYLLSQGSESAAKNLRQHSGSLRALSFERLCTWVAQTLDGVTESLRPNVHILKLKALHFVSCSVGFH